MVSFTQYKVVGNNVPIHLHEIILMAKNCYICSQTTIMGGNTKQEIEDIDIDC